MNRTLAGSALRREMQLHLYIVLGNTMTGGQIIPQSEREVFERLVVPYCEPAER
ncbi:MAG: hypothetical protein JO189_03080 [Deltaproteobacteria bacterium]|nr:hypothetical protein [Deltaproteobacteria bacterium]